jgi:hypothetical protein
MLYIEVLPDFHNIRRFKLLACQSVLYKYIVGWNGVEDKEIEMLVHKKISKKVILEQ